jgi:two-component system response regulator RegX3
MIVDKRVNSLRTRSGAAIGAVRVTTDLVIVVDPDRATAEILIPALQREGLEVAALRSSQGLDVLDRASPSLVLLDANPPHSAGIDVCRDIRRASDVPLIMLSNGASETDVVLAMEMGADDVVAKPARPRELVARIRRAIRRHQRISHGATEVLPEVDVLIYGPLTLSVSQREAHLQGAPLPLPRKEFQILALLMSQPGRAVPRDTIIRKVWGDDYVGNTKTLDVHIKRLRRKIEADGTLPRSIVTVRGFGYRFGSARDAEITRHARPVRQG